MFAIIRTTLLTYRRNRTIRQFLGIGIVRSIVSLIATSISLSEWTKIMNDIRITGIEIIGLISVIFFVATSRKKSQQDHTLHLLLTHYPHKSRIYIAQILAHLTLIGILYDTMLVLALATMYLSGHPPIAGFGLAVWLSFVKIICLTTVAQCLGSLVSGYLASILTLALYIIGHSTGFVLYYFQKHGNTMMTAIAHILYYSLPNFQALDSHAILSQSYSSLDIIIGTSIMIAYSIIITIVGVTITRRQEL